MDILTLKRSGKKFTKADIVEALKAAKRDLEILEVTHRERCGECYDEKTKAYHHGKTNAYRLSVDIVTGIINGVENK